MTYVTFLPALTATFVHIPFLLHLSLRAPSLTSFRSPSRVPQLARKKRVFRSFITLANLLMKP